MKTTQPQLGNLRHQQGSAHDPPSRLPLVLGIIGIGCWLLCPPAAIVLGLIGEAKANDPGQRAMVPRIAWIGGVVAVIVVAVLLIRTSDGVCVSGAGPAAHDCPG